MLRNVPYVVIEAGPDVAATLRRSSDVVSVVPDAPLAVADAESTPLVGATVTHAAGKQGGGRAVAVLDTGVDTAHPFLAGKTVDEACFAATRTCPNGQAVQLGSGSAAPCTFAPTDCRHGTHVAGIAVGGPAPGASFTGIAPGAKLIAVQVFSRFVDPVCEVFGEVSPCALALESDMIAGLDHVFDVAATHRVASVNLSIGGVVHTTPCDTHVLKPAVDTLRAFGIATVIAAGNESTANGIAEPGCISTAISVGATTKTDQVAPYSNSASFMKLWAPGSAIRSSVPGGGYADFNGTSMATPHVAAAFAIARQLYPSETVTQLLMRLRQGGVPITDARNGFTFPRLELLRGLRAIVAAPGSGSVNEGQPVVVPITLSRTSTLPVTVQYETLSWTATRGIDFVGKTGTVTFAAGTTSTSVSVGTVPDTTAEPDELLFIAFTNATNAAIGGLYGLGIGQIIDND